jgi:hypothetical protein
VAITDTLTTREAVRRAALDDLVARCTEAAVAIEGGPLDGIEVVSLGTLREQVAASLVDKLPAPSERYAEVRTPAHIIVSAVCPQCHIPQVIGVALAPQLVLDDDGAELKVKATTKGATHVCGQLPLDAGDQVTLDEAVTIASLRDQILRAVDGLTIVAREGNGDLPTVEAIGAAIDVTSDADLADLTETLERYALDEDAPIEVHHEPDEPRTYWLTDAGRALVAAMPADADEEADADDLDQPDESGEA